MNTMIHRGYAARIDYSEDDGCFVGHIAGINDIVGFHGESVAELRAALKKRLMITFKPAKSWIVPLKRLISAILWQVFHQKSTQRLALQQKTTARV